MKDGSLLVCSVGSGGFELNMSGDLFIKPLKKPPCDCDSVPVSGYPFLASDGGGAGITQAASAQRVLGREGARARTVMFCAFDHNFLKNGKRTPGEGVPVSCGDHHPQSPAPTHLRTGIRARHRTMSSRALWGLGVSHRTRPSSQAMVPQATRELRV